MCSDFRRFVLPAVGVPVTEIEKIYRGETMEQMGIPAHHYALLQAELALFLAEVGEPDDFEAQMFAWGANRVRPIKQTITFRRLDEGKVAGEEPTSNLADNNLPPMPDLVDRVGNLVPALFRWAVAGLPVESRGEAEKHLAICETNECGFFDGSVCRHIKCGCFSKIKTFLSTEHCPIGRW